MVSCGVVIESLGALSIATESLVEVPRVNERRHSVTVEFSGQGVLLNGQSLAESAHFDPCNAQQKPFFQARSVRNVVHYSPIGMGGIPVGIQLTQAPINRQRVCPTAPP